ncbi:MAG: HpcH/HpaI aldolase/citrate lyase family protein [Thermoplasmatales archaeon]|nr:HpcH/HpaI aldolase/citrate lyase family protein [Thermoplasmatales archaeon]
MKINEESFSGTENERDCIVRVFPGDGEIILKSKISLYKEHIEEIVRKRLEEIDVKANVEITENGAIDYVIISRLESAIAKATGEDIVDKKFKRGKTSKDRIRRSRLYIPGNNPRLINSVGVYECDCIILDLEDSVIFEHKIDARYLVKNALKNLDFGKSEIWVRINKEMARDDILQIAYGNPHGLCIPKTESKEDVEVIEKIIDEAGLDCYLMPIIETAKGVANANEIARASERIVAIAFGAEDYSRDVGCKRTWEALFYPRCQVLIACKSAGLQALDTIYPNAEDEKGLSEEARRVFEMGFDGKGAIHPSQIEIIHECFTPTAEEIEEAKRIIEKIEEAKKKGLGTATIDGRMIDLPVERKARRILKLAEIK